MKKKYLVFVEILDRKDAENAKDGNYELEKVFTSLQEAQNFYNKIDISLYQNNLCKADQQSYFSQKNLSLADENGSWLETINYECCDTINK